MSDLSEFEPILVGTIPIAIEIENSDLDILCYWKEKTGFIQKITALFKHQSKFSIEESTIDGFQTVIAKYHIAGFDIEIFGQNRPVQSQNGYRHMVIEHHILQTKGETFRQEIIQLKQKGYKTEPAFALLLKLQGDPYNEMLQYKTVGGNAKKRPVRTQQ